MVEVVSTLDDTSGLEGSCETAEHHFTSRGQYQFSLYIQGIGFTSEQEVRVGLLCFVMSITLDD